MNSETIIEVTKTLIGNIVPVGDFYKDNIAYENQDKLIELTETCIDLLIRNTIYKDRSEYHAERIGKKAQETLKKLYFEVEKSL